MKFLLKEMFKDKNVGAVAASSRFLVKNMVNKIDFNTANTIVEFGPGTGNITQKLLKNMSKDAILYVFEINKDFLKKLSKIDDKRIILINADAESAKQILKEKYNVDHVDYIVSSLPFALFDKNKRERIIKKSFDLLKDSGKFITFQYSLILRKLINETFTSVKTRLTLFNIPPAFVFVGIK